jgi:hypothetical protein
VALTPDCPAESLSRLQGRESAHQHGTNIAQLPHWSRKSRQRPRKRAFETQNGRVEPRPSCFFRKFSSNQHSQIFAFSIFQASDNSYTTGMAVQGDRLFPFVSAAVLFATVCLFCAADTLIDASSHLHPLCVSVRLPSSSQLLFYSISLASALAHGESAAETLGRSVVHPSLSPPVVSCSSSINSSSSFTFNSSNSSTGNSSSSIYDVSTATETTCVFSSNLTAPLESLLLRTPDPSSLLLSPPSFTACIRAFSAAVNFSFSHQRCSSLSCTTELQSFRSSMNTSEISTVVCEPLIISLPPLVLAASFGSQTVVIPSLVPTGSTTPLLNASFTAAVSAGTDLKLLVLVSSLASNFTIEPVNQPPPPCQYSSSVSFAPHSNIVLEKASTWLSLTLDTPVLSAVPYDAFSPFAALLRSSTLVARLAVMTFTFKPCLFAPVYNQPFCVVPHVTQPAAYPTIVQRDARFVYAFSQQSRQSQMTVSTPFICASYSLPLPRPYWLTVGPDMLGAQTITAAMFAPTHFPTAIQHRNAAAVISSAAAEVVSFRARLECFVWRVLLSQRNSASFDAFTTTESPCPVTPPSMLPGLQLVSTAADCRVLIPFNASSGISGFNLSLSFMQSPSAERFSFHLFSGTAVDHVATQFSATGERVDVLAEATFTFRDVGAIVPLCAVIWTLAASPFVDASAFNASLTRTHCVMVSVRSCAVCGRLSIAYTATTMYPRVSPQLLMALNLETVRSLSLPPPGFSVSPRTLLHPQIASQLLPELKRTQAFNMSEGHLLQTGIVHTVVKGDSLATVTVLLHSNLSLLEAANPGLPMNASEAGTGGGDYELIEGAMLCVQPLSSSNNAT